MYSWTSNNCSPNLSFSTSEQSALPHHGQWNIPISTLGSPVVTTPKKPKRIRTAFVTNQTNALEREFQENRYLNRERRGELSKELNLSERTLKIWFQNRRMKEKKEKAEGNFVPPNVCDTTTHNMQVTGFNIQPQPVQCTPGHSFVNTDSQYQLPDHVAYQQPQWSCDIPSSSQQFQPNQLGYHVQYGSYPAHGTAASFSQNQVPVYECTQQLQQPPDNNGVGFGVPSFNSGNVTDTSPLVQANSQAYEYNNNSSTLNSDSTWVGSIYPEGYEALIENYNEA